MANKRARRQPAVSGFKPWNGGRVAQKASGMGEVLAQSPSGGPHWVAITEADSRLRLLTGFSGE